MPTVHQGHRGRLRRRVETEGLQSFQPHEVLEYLLFQTIPQRDVNPLAHALIARFGSVSAVLRAPVSELTQVPGVGARTAQWLNLLDRVTDDYMSLTMRDRLRFDRLKLVKSHCETIFPPADGNELWMFNMNLAGYLLHRDRIADGAGIAHTPLRLAIEPTLRYHAMTAVALFRRTRGALAFSNEEIDFIGRLARQLQTIGAQLLDGVLYLDGNVLSMRVEGTLRLSVAGSALRDAEADDLYIHWLDDINNNFI